MDVAADYEIVEFLEPLVVFGWGVLLRVRCGDVQLIGYLQSSDNAFTEAVEDIASRYPPGHVIRLEAELSQVDDSGLEVVDGALPLGIQVTRTRPQSPAHDVIVSARVVAHDQEADRLVLDCGIPLVAAWSDWSEAPGVGRNVRWQGDLWLHRK
jgi:hypothetical protein